MPQSAITSPRFRYYDCLNRGHDNIIIITRPADSYHHLRNVLSRAASACSSTRTAACATSSSPWPRENTTSNSPVCRPVWPVRGVSGEFQAPLPSCRGVRAALNIGPKSLSLPVRTCIGTKGHSIGKYVPNGRDCPYRWGHFGPQIKASHSGDRVASYDAVALVLGYWEGVRRPFHLSLFITAPLMVLPQDPSTDHFPPQG